MPPAPDDELPPDDEVDRIVAAWQRERPDLDIEPLTVLSRVTRLARHLDLLRRGSFAEHDLEPWEFDVLSALRRSGAPYRLSPGALLTQTLVVWFLAAVRGWYFVRKNGLPRWAAPGNWTWLWVYTIAIAAASYIISVCSKWDESKGQWLKNSPYVATQIVKTHRQNYYNSLDPQFIQGVQPATAPVADPATDRYRYPIPRSADWLGRHPDLARLIFGAGFFLELLVFLAVLDRRAALLFGLCLVSLHGSIAWLMELSFPFNERTVGVFFVNAAGWLILMAKDPAWRPSRKVWLGCLLGATALLAAHLATWIGSCVNVGIPAARHQVCRLRWGQGRASFHRAGYRT